MFADGLASVHRGGHVGWEESTDESTIFDDEEKAPVAVETAQEAAAAKKAAEDASVAQAAAEEARAAQQAADDAAAAEKAAEAAAALLAAEEAAATEKAAQKAAAAAKKAAEDSAIANAAADAAAGHVLPKKRKAKSPVDPYAEHAQLLREMPIWKVCCLCSCFHECLLAACRWISM
jgi:hypothetical protein